MPECPLVPIPLLRTKTFWAGLGSIAAGFAAAVQGDPVGGMVLISQGFLAIFQRNAISKAK